MRSPFAILIAGCVLLGALLLLVVAGPVRDDARPRTSRGVDPAKTRPDGPSLLRAGPLRAATTRLRDRHRDARLVALRLDRRRLTATLVTRDGRLVTATMRSNGLDRFTSTNAPGGSTGATALADLTPGTLPRILQRVTAASGRPVADVLFLALDGSGTPTVTYADGARWTARLDGTRVRGATPDTDGGAVDVDALRRCFEAARTPAEQAACAP